MKIQATIRGFIMSYRKIVKSIITLKLSLFNTPTLCYATITNTH